MPSKPQAPILLPKPLAKPPRNRAQNPLEGKPEQTAAGGRQPSAHSSSLTKIKDFHSPQPPLCSSVRLEKFIVPPTSKSRNESSYGIAIGGFLVVAVFGTTLLFNLIAYRSSEYWISRKAEVLKIEATSKTAEMEYRYSMDEVDYTASRFVILSGGTLQFRDTILESYEVGDEIKVLVNPRQPSQATVLRGSISNINHEVIVILFGVLLTVIGSHRICRFQKRTRSKMVEQVAAPQIRPRP